MPYEQLLLQNQLCFPLYACSREVVRLYTPHLEPLGLTYTQYIVLMVLWEANDEAADVSVGELGKRLHLDSGTLTPLLKKMEASGIVSRARSISDERVVLVSITDKGMELRDKCKDIPTHIGRCLNLNDKDFNELYKLLYKALDNMNS